MTKVYEAIGTWVADQTGVAHASGSAAIASLAGSLREFALPSEDAAGILKLISGPGYKSATRNIISNWGDLLETITSDQLQKLAESAATDSDKCRTNTGGKGRRTWSGYRSLQRFKRPADSGYLQADGPARHTEFSVMLDHAARHVSIVHSWIKRAEGRRREFEEGAKKLPRTSSAGVRRRSSWPERFCEKRSTSLGADASGGGYRIRKRALEGWDEVVKAWVRSTPLPERGRSDRRGTRRKLDPEIQKFGDIQLFEAMATDDATCVWKSLGWHTGRASVLKDFRFRNDRRA